MAIVTFCDDVFLYRNLPIHCKEALSYACRCFFCITFDCFNHSEIFPRLPSIITIWMMKWKMILRQIFSLSKVRKELLLGNFSFVVICNRKFIE